jgi:hypothetical protein
MRIHSDVLIMANFYGATKAAKLSPDVWVEDFSQHGSRKRSRGYEVRLAAEAGRDYKGTARRPRNSGSYGAEDGTYQKAATYDEHGKWIAELYKVDPEAIVGPYKNAEDFHSKTRYAYDM